MRVVVRRLFKAFLGLAFLACAAAVAAASPQAPPSIDAPALVRASDAVVGVRVLALDEAASARTLGQARQGSGVVIGPDDLVLTIGYLVLEADEVQLLTDDGRKVPARVVAYDVATGFGLVQALAPLRIAPVPVGNAASVGADDALMVASGGESGGISVARMVSRRAFAGYWEYLIDGALFTAPARGDHSGAGLFNARGELLGIGSLFVADAAGPGSPKVAGNMFVPVDLLKPILGELRQAGRSAASRRAWLGLNCVEQAGEVRVVRVSDDSPADAGGLKPGDRIVRIDGTEVHALDALWKQLWSGGQPEREVVLDIRRGDQAQTLKLQSVDRMQTLKKAQGI